MAVAAYRLLFAALLLLPALCLRGRKSLPDRKTLPFVLGSGAFLALHFATWISSLSLTSVASSVILVNTVPLWVALFSLLTGEKLSRVMLLALAMSFCGGALIGYGDFSFSLQALRGDLLALAGAMSFAGYVLLGKKVRPHLSLLTYVGVCYGSAALFLCTTNLFLRVPMTGFSPKAWWIFLGSALVPQILGHSIVNWALARCSAHLVSISLLGESLVSSLLAWVLFGEVPNPIAYPGFALLLTALFLAAREEGRRQE
ncbi:MAG: DMT family transporter [Fretibacterium sp.]|nr:DMT family transporter [Fretibacterium sp.]